ncbi:unnamed protein product [Prunus armeniaca]
MTQPDSPSASSHPATSTFDQLIPISVVQPPPVPPLEMTQPASPSASPHPATSTFDQPIPASVVQPPPVPVLRRSQRHHSPPHALRDYVCNQVTSPKPSPSSSSGSTKGTRMLSPALIQKQLPIHTGRTPCNLNWQLYRPITLGLSLPSLMARNPLAVAGFIKSNVTQMAP